MPTVMNEIKGEGNSINENDEIMEVVEVEDDDKLPVPRPPRMLVSGRTTDDVEAIMSVAKLDKADLLAMSQEVIFDTDYSSTEYRLLQLDKAIINHIQTGEVLVFRGEENDSAVLCTENETYEIKDAETSNSLLLFRDIHIPEKKSSTSSGGSSSSKSPVGSANNSLNSSGLNDSVMLQNEDIPEEDYILNVKPTMILDVAHSYLEMKKMVPNLSKIRFLLRRSSYDEDNPDEISNTDTVTLDTLLEKVAASKQEILSYLNSARVVEIDGQLKLVDDDYLFKIFSQVMNCVDENSWSPTEIDKEVVIQTLSPLAKPFFLEKIFEWFFIPFLDDPNCPSTSSSSLSSSSIKYTYQEENVCGFLGQVLLKTMGRFNLAEFKKIWQESVPEGLKVNLSQLRGVAVYDEDSSPPTIWHFPEYNLPETFTERLALLFETKKRWKLDEITPYLQVFATGLQSVGVLLTKYARGATVNGVKCYTSKHGR